jgi:hypothetical protein
MRSDHLDTVKLADQLNDIAGGIMLADLAVAGLGDDGDLYRCPAVGALRELLLKLAKKVNKISHDIHPGPSGAA